MSGFLFLANTDFI